jgi:hypothetical protein
VVSALSRSTLSSSQKQDVAIKGQEERDLAKHTQLSPATGVGRAACLRHVVQGDTRPIKHIFNKPGPHCGRELSQCVVTRQQEEKGSRTVLGAHGGSSPSQLWPSLEVGCLRCVEG